MARIKDPIRENGYVTVPKLANELQISFGKCHSCLTVDVNMEQSAEKCMPQLLNACKGRIISVLDLLEKLREPWFLCKVFEPVITHRFTGMAKKHLLSTKMLGIVCHKLTPQGQTVKQAFSTLNFLSCVQISCSHYCTNTKPVQ